MNTAQVTNEVKESVRFLADKSNNAHVRVQCPVCSNQRKKSHEKTMAVSKLNDKYVFNCHHCGLNGASFNKENSNKEYVQPIKPIKV